MQSGNIFASFVSSFPGRFQWILEGIRAERSRRVPGDLMARHMAIHAVLIFNVMMHDSSNDRIEESVHITNVIHHYHCQEINKSASPTQFSDTVIGKIQVLFTGNLKSDV